MCAGNVKSKGRIQEKETWVRFMLLTWWKFPDVTLDVLRSLSPM
jgi:hypothetical protein